MPDMSRRLAIGVVLPCRRPLKRPLGQRHETPSSGCGWSLRATAVLPCFLFVIPAALATAQGIRFERSFPGIEFVHQHGGSGQYYMPETMGSGVVIFDFDQDGDQDVLLLSSGPLRGFEGPARPSQLFRNDAGAFEPHAGGLEIGTYAMGAVAADLDGDTVPDLVVTGFGATELHFGEGSGQFTRGPDLPSPPSWSASAALDDIDRDGDLDLYVTHYVNFSYDNNPICGVKERGLRSYCHPNVYEGLQDRLYENVGQGTFVDRTTELGIGVANGNGLGVAFGDIDLDGSREIYVANDMTPNFMFQRSGVTKPFEEVALLTGTALSGQGTAEAGMGVAFDDLDGDGLPDIVTTHLDQQTNAVYGNTPAGVFVDRRYSSKLAEPSLPFVGFGVAVADLDHDGHADLVIANGHIVHNVEAHERGTSFRQPNQIFRGLGDGTFALERDAGLDVVESSRGAALGDLDGDGDLDLVINNSNAAAEVYRNLHSGAGSLQVVAEKGGRPDFGTRVRVTTGKRSRSRELRAGSSYLSQSQAAAHFGAAGESEATVDLVWSDGSRSRYVGMPAGRTLRIRR